MNRLRRTFVPAGVLALLVGAVVLVAPRVSQAVTATLVQVVNAPAKVVATGSATLTDDGKGDVTQGPFDVSEYSSIRFFGDPTPVTVNVTFELRAVDSTGAEYVLDQLTAQAEGPAGGVLRGSYVTGVYQTPGASLKVRMSATGSCGGCTIPVNFVIYGR